MFLHICTVGLGSTNSASEVGMVENVKFNNDFKDFGAKPYTVQGGELLLIKKRATVYILINKYTIS